MPKDSVSRKAAAAKKTKRTITKPSDEQAPPDGLNNPPRPWTAYFAGEQSTVHEFTLALGEHTTLQENLAQCRLAVGEATRKWTAELAATATLTSQQSAVIDYEVMRCVVRAINWVLHRYWRIAVAAHSEIQLPPMVFAAAIETAIHGTWEDAVTRVDAALAQDYQGRHVGIHITPVLSAIDATALTNSWSCGNGKPGYLLPTAPYGQSQEVYIATITDFIKKNWGSIAPPSAPYGLPYPGRRNVGRPTHPYRRRVALYNLDREHPRATDPEFFDLVYEDERFNDWHSASRTITDARAAAIKWGAPDPTITDTLANFSHNEDSTSRLWHKLFT